MNKIKEARLNMYDAVITYCSNNTPIVNTVSAFQTALTDFQATVDNIYSTAQLEVDVITGITADKAQLRETLCQQAADLGSVVFAFASSSDNNELKQKANFTVSDLRRLKDGLLSLTCTNIRDAAKANLPALATFDITPATLNDFSTVIDNYDNKISSPRVAVSQRSAYSKTLTNLFKQADSILKSQMDKVAVRFKAANEEFYNAYKNNRIIIDPGSSNTQIAGVINSAGDNLPMQGATVQVVGTSITDTTDADGNYTLKSVPIGTQSVKIAKPGFADTILDNILVKLGKTSTVNKSIEATAK